MPDVAFDTLVAAAVEAWPSLRVSRAEFAAHLGELVSSAPAQVILAELRVADLYLVFGCLRGDSEAWRELDRVHLSRIAEYVRSVDPSPAFAADVRQRLSEKLLGDSEAGARLASYRGRGALSAWMRVMAIHEARTIRRGRKRSVDLDDVQLQASGLDPEIALLKQRSASTLRVAFAEVIAGLPNDEKAALRMHYIDGLTIAEVGAALRVSRATAGRFIAQARDRILKRVDRALRAELGDDAPAAKSLLGIVRSELDLSLVRHFQGSADDREL